MKSMPLAWGYFCKNMFDQTSLMLKSWNKNKLKAIDKSKEKNYGWPIASLGKPYPGEADIFEEKNWLTKTHEENGFLGPLRSFSPAIGISEVVFLKDKFYVSSLRAGSIYILEIDKNFKKINSEERLFFKEQRIRDIEYDPELKLFLAIFSYTPSIAVIKQLD